MFSSFLKMVILHKNMFKISSASICSFFKIYLNSFFFLIQSLYTFPMFSVLLLHMLRFVFETLVKVKFAKIKQNYEKDFINNGYLENRYRMLFSFLKKYIGKYVMYSFYLLHMINQYSVFKRFSNQQD